MNSLDPHRIPGVVTKLAPHALYIFLQRVAGFDFVCPDNTLYEFLRKGHVPVLREKVQKFELCRSQYKTIVAKEYLICRRIDHQLAAVNRALIITLFGYAYSPQQRDYPRHDYHKVARQRNVVVGSKFNGFHHVHIVFLRAFDCQYYRYIGKTPNLSYRLPYAQVRQVFAEDIRQKCSQFGLRVPDWKPEKSKMTEEPFIPG